MMNLPNALTLSRIGFAFILVYLLLLNSLTGNILAAVLFTIASLTDFYDGHLAKKRGLISDFGKIMDPIADKVLILSIFFVLAYTGRVAWWMVWLITFREIVVTADRLWCMRKGEVLAAEKAGKIKTVFQITVISFILIHLILNQAAFAQGWFHRIANFYWGFVHVLMDITVGITIGSGISYFQSKTRKTTT